MIAFLLVTLSAWSHLCALSPPPPPTPRPTTEIKQNAGDTDATVSNPTPVTAGVIDGRDHANHQSDTRDEESSANWTIAWLTGVLAFAALVQIGVTIVQAYFMRRGISVSLKAARAAQDSARIAKKAVDLAEHNTATTERAIILIESVVAGPQTGLAFPYLAANSVLIFTLKNYGATVAYSVNVTGKVSSADGSLEINGAQGVPLAPQGSNQWITKSLLTQIPPDEIKRINAAERPFTYHVDVTYDDAFGNSHEYEQEGQFIAVIRGFVTGSSTSN